MPLSFSPFIGNPYYDSLGSLGVGTLLGTVSAFLIYTNTEALLGRSIQAEHVQKLTEFLENDPAVRSVLRPCLSPLYVSSTCTHSLHNKSFISKQAATLQFMTVL